MNKNTATARANQVDEQPARKRSIDELKALADEGNAWAISKVDEWEQHFGDDYAGSLTDRCPDQDCEYYGEPVNLCCDEHGNLIEVDHGTWGHRLTARRAA